LTNNRTEGSLGGSKRETPCPISDAPMPEGVDARLPTKWQSNFIAQFQNASENKLDRVKRLLGKVK